MKTELLDLKRIKKATVGLLKGTGGERSEPEVPERSPTVAAQKSPSIPDPEVPAHPRRRHHSAAYKLRILNEADSVGPSGIGVLLRREGLYSSNLTLWRRQKEQGELNGKSSKKRGPTPKMDESTRRKMAHLEKNNSRLARRLMRAEQIIEVQKKISELLGIPLNLSENGEND